MGVEAFGISMQLVNRGEFRGILGFLSQYGNIRFQRTEADSYFETVVGEYSDGIHFIDLQIRHAVTSDQCDLAVRFSLCSYDTIDAIFIKLIGDVLAAWEAEAWLMTSAIKQKTNYLPGDARWLLAALPDEIVEMRRYWQNLFGTRQGAVRARDSFSFAGVVKHGYALGQRRNNTGR
jgi:hypothetical protein